MWNLENYKTAFLLILYLFICKIIKFYYYNHQTRAWVNKQYPPLHPNSIQGSLVSDLKHYILCTFIFVYTLVSNITILDAIIFNVFISIHFIFHLYGNWKRTFKIFSKYHFTLSGFKLYKERTIKEVKKDNDFLPLGVVKYFQLLIDIYHSELINIIQDKTLNKHQKIEEIKHSKIKIDRDSFTIPLIHKFRTNLLFFSNIVFIILINTNMLASLFASSIITFASFEPLKYTDALYAIVQTFSTIGFGDIAPSNHDGRLFFLIVFIQTIFVIVIFISYRNSIIDAATELFDKVLTQIIGEIDTFKSKVIECIKLEKFSENMELEFNRIKDNDQYSTYFLFLHRLRDELNANSKNG